MLEGVDEIDWKNLGHHVYGKHDRIPEEIRNLLAQEPQVREEARGFLLGSGQDFGDIYDTTPHIIPFLIELLTHAGTPEKADLLWHLSGVTEYVLHSRHLSIHMMRLCLEAYQALQTGLSTLIALLRDETVGVRLASAHVLSQMTDEVECLIPEFIQCFRTEREEDVQIGLLDGLKTLFGSLEWPRYRLKDEYAPFFKKVVETHPSRKARVAAARASVELISPYAQRTDRLSAQVPALLTQEFIEPISPLNYMEQGSLAYHAERIMQDLARVDPEPLVDLLQNPTISAEQAHVIARGILANAFLSPGRSDAHWRLFPNLHKRDKGLFYVQDHAAVGFIKYQRAHLLQAIVDADKVWEAPTNLFSFFYGLPDSREGLRTLLEESGSVSSQSLP